MRLALSLSGLLSRGFADIGLMQSSRNSKRIHLLQSSLVGLQGGYVCSNKPKFCRLSRDPLFAELHKSGRHRPYIAHLSKPAQAIEAELRISDYNQSSSVHSKRESYLNYTKSDKCCASAFAPSLPFLLVGSWLASFEGDVFAAFARSKASFFEHGHAHNKQILRSCMFKYKQMLRYAACEQLCRSLQEKDSENKQHRNSDATKASLNCSAASSSFNSGLSAQKADGPATVGVGVADCVAGNTAAASASLGDLLRRLSNLGGTSGLGSRSHFTSHSILLHHFNTTNSATVSTNSQTYLIIFYRNLHKYPPTILCLHHFSNCFN
ncbi:hypothetical protein IFM89_023413 [Coptis chinensis]|uniref:Uncharacterized protein n=1 Tax=Coptis chinensis TaxID=261450 RepID=A0A835GXI2_9MAGN|nr:hypothetical protein IFM89_023413 [Coptis chinensis]